jgi:hypothetical protein
MISFFLGPFLKAVGDGPPAEGSPPLATTTSQLSFLREAP